MMTLKRTIAAMITLLLILASAACLSNPARRYYQINLDKSAIQNSLSSEKTLIIDTVDVDAFYDNYRIVYRDSKYEINHYLHHLWYKEPARMIQESLLNYFQTKGLFSQVFTHLKDGSPDFILFCKVSNIEEQYEGRQSWARLGMAWRLCDFKSGSCIVAHQFDRREPIAGQRMADVVKGLSLILQQELTQFSRLIAEKTKENV